MCVFVIEGFAYRRAAEYRSTFSVAALVMFLDSPQPFASQAKHDAQEASAELPSLAVSSITH